ncbi:MAG: type II toxin-antitoxin system VapC family toxin [Thaumarchaeota archaeon]|nr:type II toxin-antitoxin system VapC family toxin [Nitrososphaerota archaeon]
MVDTVILAAAALRRDARHEDASHIISAIASGKAGKCFFTDYTLGETLTLIRFHTRGGLEASNRMYELLLFSKNLQMVRLSDGELKIAGEIFRKYPRLSFVDSATVALMLERRIKDMLSFDNGFDTVPTIKRHERLSGVVI